MQNRACIFAISKHNKMAFKTLDSITVSNITTLGMSSDVAEELHGDLTKIIQTDGNNLPEAWKNICNRILTPDLPFSFHQMKYYRCYRDFGPDLHLEFPTLSSCSPPFGIAFDIDGVKGNSLIGGSPQALRRLYGESGTLKIPYLLLTNGGGIPEYKRALGLSKMLDVNILPLQVVQGHRSFKELANRFENELTEE